MKIFKCVLPKEMKLLPEATLSQCFRNIISHRAICVVHHRKIRAF